MKFNSKTFWTVLWSVCVSYKLITWQVGGSLGLWLGLSILQVIYQIKINLVSHLFSSTIWNWTSLSFFRCFRRGSRLPRPSSKHWVAKQMPGQYHRNDQIQIVFFIFIRLRPDIFFKNIPSKRELSNILLLLSSAESFVDALFWFNNFWEMHQPPRHMIMGLR